MTTVEEPALGGWSGDFSYEYYRTLIETLEARFDVRPLSAFRTASRTQPLALLRHDVDVCLDRAVELARFERELGVRSTYMVIPDSPLYDVEANAEALRTIEAMGHEIGLHYAHEYGESEDGSDDVDLERQRMRIRRARRRLESLGIGPIASVSFHLPTDRVLEGPSSIAGLVNAYGRELMSTYISDSGGRWREGPPIGSIDGLTDPSTVQVLTHPIWWGLSHEPPIVRYVERVSEYDRLTDEMIDELVTIYPKAEPYVRASARDWDADSIRASRTAGEPERRRIPTSERP
ncbi:polysaccharide deacetylase family protein [Natronolimnohabitans innermongolicus]|uniref:Polysaccharide deacetylase n=1 Tax=Natronolimnohabitans innermongolicus JCM 12255 TaxID=1227499 RepID=L9WI44_9EURY|nr:hypothetical protein [Natronolimnohabitans innermongolicus]ELY48911.1 hypothetical protein C493_21526 [Natronolimnohabitans innermongolicus JCM 12255]